MNQVTGHPGLFKTRRGSGTTPEYLHILLIYMFIYMRAATQLRIQEPRWNEFAFYMNTPPLPATGKPVS